MNLRIKTIADRGIPDKERLVLEVLRDTDLTYYAVFDSIYLSPNTVSNHVKRAYWFDAKRVRAKDLVILYTRPGTPSETTNSDGTTWHFFFWGLEKTVWNLPEDCTVLVNLNEWVASHPQREFPGLGK